MKSVQIGKVGLKTSWFKYMDGDPGLLHLSPITVEGCMYQWLEQDISGKSFPIPLNTKRDFYLEDGVLILSIGINRKYRSYIRFGY